MTNITLSTPQSEHKNIPCYEVIYDFKREISEYLTGEERDRFEKAISMGAQSVRFGERTLSKNFIKIVLDKETLHQIKNANEKIKGPQTNVPHWVTEMQKQKDAEIRRQIDERRKELQAKN